MRIAVVSDIHGNLTALEAVIANLRCAAPDLVVHGGDLIVGGPRPTEVIDCFSRAATRSPASTAETLRTGRYAELLKS